MSSTHGAIKRRLFILIISFLLSQLLQLLIIGTSDDQETQQQQQKIKKISEPIDNQSEAIKPTTTSKYHVNRFYKSEGFPARHIPTDYDVTIAIHGGIDRLQHLPALVEKWKGAMVSYAVFAPGSDAAHADDVIDGLRMCWTEVRHHVVFHLVYPSDDVADVGEAGSFVYLACKDVIRRLRKMTSSSAGGKYPHNVMRNVARSGVITRYVVDADGDALPSSNLRKNFRSLLESRGDESDVMTEKEVFVLPIFEVKEEMENFEELFHEDNARPYLHETCPSCHKPTNYDKWLQMTANKQPPEGATYQVDVAVGWEPFFVINQNSPEYDVTMTKYGFDRLSYICRLRAEGYKFTVMTSSYLYTRGYRSRLVANTEQLRRVRNEEGFMKSFYSSLIARGYTSHIKC